MCSEGVQGARDPGGVPGHHLEVLGVGTHVDRRDVATTEGRHETGVGLQQSQGLLGARIGVDDALVSTEVETRDGCLVGHRLGQVHRVGDRQVPTRVTADAHTTEGRAQAGVVRVPRAQRVGLECR